MAMTDEHRNVLREKRIELLKNMSIADPSFLAYFQRDRTLTEEMIAEIREPLVYTNRERVAKLLDRLPSRGANAFHILIEALRETEQAHVAKILDPSVTTPSDETDSAQRAGGDGDGPATGPNSDFIVNMIEQRSALQVRHTGSKVVKEQLEKCKTIQPANCKALILSVSNGGMDKGLEEDRKLIETLFKDLGFAVHHLTVKEDELVTKLLEEASNLSASHEAFVLFILRCRGNLNVEDIFDGNNCKGLSGKPKLMFLQICDNSTGQKSQVVPGDSKADGDEKHHRKIGIITARIYEKPDATQGSLGVKGVCYTFAEYTRYCSIGNLLVTANLVVSKLKKKRGLGVSGDIVVYKLNERFFFNLCV